MRDIRFEIDVYLIDRFKDNQAIEVITDHDDHAIVLINGVQLEESYDAIEVFGLSRFFDLISLELKNQGLSGL